MATISLCIATYRRPERLAAVLADIALQSLLPDEVIVVDNDASRSAAPVVDERLKVPSPFLIRYAMQPEKNISLTRNKTVELAAGEWLAFIDDDERAPPQWLEQLVEAAARFKADGVLGPVDPVVPATAPQWIRRGRFYQFPRMATGSIIPPNRLRFGNVLLKGSWLRGREPPFDPALGLTGGEDGDLLSRLALRGARLIWCDEAIVHEPIEAARLSLAWLLRRALSGGQDFARHALAGRYGAMPATHKLRFFLRALVQAATAATLVLLVWPWGRHRVAKWLTVFCANIGKLSVFCGWRYREYA